MLRNFFEFSKKKQKNCLQFLYPILLQTHVNFVSLKGFFFSFFFQGDGVCNLIDQNLSRQLHIGSHGVLKNYRRIVNNIYYDCKFWVLFFACLLIIKVLIVLAFDICLKIGTSLSNIVPCHDGIISVLHVLNSA